MQKSSAESKSEVIPSPAELRTFTATIFASGAMPLYVASADAMIPVIWVPCPLLSPIVPFVCTLSPFGQQEELFPWATLQKHASLMMRDPNAE